MDNISIAQGGQLCWARDWLESNAPIAQVSLASLQPGDLPRHKAQSKAEAQAMVDAVDVPPIIVHQSSMRVIDGGRRVTAATARHQDTIAVRFFDGTVDEAFLLAVAANITHGLPLCTRDRKVAAARILGMYPDWSDRRVAAAAGLAHRTVAGIRRNLSTGQNTQLTRRRGIDGRTRPAAPKKSCTGPVPVPVPINATSLPATDDSLAATIHDGRARRAHGADLAARKARAVNLPFSLARGQALFARLRKDPSVSFNDKGRAVLEVFSRSLRVAQDAHEATQALPEHCRDAAAEFALSVGDSWIRLAHELRSHAQTI